MYDKKAEITARRYHVSKMLKSLEEDLIAIRGIDHVEFDFVCTETEIMQVILIPKYTVPVSLPALEYYAARRQMIESITEVCRKHGLRPSGDRIEDYGEHWYIVRNCDLTWKAPQAQNRKNHFQEEITLC